MFDTFQNRLTITGALVTQTGFRIGAGRRTEPVGTDLPIIRDAVGRPFIPGSSFKGVLRTQAEQIVRAILPHRRDGACIPTGGDEERCISPTEMAALRRQYRDERLAEEVWNRTCMICQVFGSPWLASHVQVRDLPVDEEAWFGQFQVRDGVAIDRDKGTAAEGLLYNYETVPAGTRFPCHIVLDNAADWQRGLLWLALRPFVDGHAALGGFTSRGLGWVELEDYELRLVKTNGDPLALIDALTEEAPIVAEDQPRQWVRALKEELRQMVG